MKPFMETYATTFHTTSFLSSAMDQELKKSISKIKDDTMMPIGTKWQKIKQKLQENGLLYQQTLKPAQLLVHPKNRGGAMLSHHDCHQKGANILAIGADLQKIQSSVAIEVSNLKQTKKDQRQWSNKQKAPFAHQMARKDTFPLAPGCSPWLHHCQ